MLTRSGPVLKKVGSLWTRFINRVVDSIFVEEIFSSITPLQDLENQALGCGPAVDPF